MRGTNNNPYKNKGPQLFPSIFCLRIEYIFLAAGFQASGMHSWSHLSTKLSFNLPIIAPRVSLNPRTDWLPTALHPNQLGMVHMTAQHSSSDLAQMPQGNVTQPCSAPDMQLQRTNWEGIIANCGRFDSLPKHHCVGCISKQIPVSLKKMWLCCWWWE